VFPAGTEAGGEDPCALVQLICSNIWLIVAKRRKTGETTRELEAARLFIDQLEMLEAKTRGNLTPPETRLLQQSLMTVRLAYVETVEAPAPEKPAASESAPAADSTAAAAPTPETPGDEESRKRFSKKY
jgi:hypothetical protein